MVEHRIDGRSIKIDKTSPNSFDVTLLAPFEIGLVDDDEYPRPLVIKARKGFEVLIQPPMKDVC